MKKAISGLALKLKPIPRSELVEGARVYNKRVLRRRAEYQRLSVLSIQNIRRVIVD
jgi:hypothetical protein